MKGERRGDEEREDKMEGERKGGKEMEGERGEKGSKGKVKTQTLTNDGCSTTPV